VTLAGETLYRFPINQSRTQEIAASQGFSLTMVIENGEVYVEKATCPDLVCQNHRPISRSGEQIICLPGRVVIAITGEEAEIDAVTQ
jgi:hypothetical protein